MKGKDVVCLIKNSATLAGSLYTLHVSQIRIELPTLTDKDKEVFVFELYFTIQERSNPFIPCDEKCVLVCGEIR